MKYSVKNKLNQRVKYKDIYFNEIGRASCRERV